jgi:CRP-like cAMP-binding protein
VSLFASLTEAELRVVAGGMSPAIYVADELITRQGAVAHWLYILTTGRVEVRTHVDIDGDGPAPDRTRAVATLEAPAFFGEMSLVTGEPRRADVIALGDVECLRLGRATFERVIHDRPEIAGEVSTILARRAVELQAVREDLSDEARRARESIERERILSGIKKFFGL